MVYYKSLKPVSFEILSLVLGKNEARFEIKRFQEVFKRFLSSCLPFVKHAVIETSDNLYP